MDLQRKFMSSAVLADATLGERQIRVVASSPVSDREKDIMVPTGVMLKNFVRNPIVLADHDRTKPIGTAAPEVKNGRLEALITFAPLGASSKADEYCALAKAGVLNSVSVGFMPIEVKPNKAGGVDINEWELLELSLVAVPANPDALVIARSASGETENLKVGASRNLPPAKDAKWDATAAAERILKQAGFDGDAPNSAWARKGFLVYDAVSADQKDAYQFPFADVVDGRLMIVPAALAAARGEIEKSETIGALVKSKALAVIEHYEAEMKKAVVPLKVKDLYDVAQAAYALATLGYIQSSAAWEAEVEGDGSKVPEMLADAARAFADALNAMTAEETAELLAQMVPAGEKAAAKGLCKKEAKPLVKALAVVKVKAGAKFSMATKSAINEACKSIMGGHDAIKGLLDDSDDDDDDNCDPDTGNCDEDDSDTEKSAREHRLREVEVLSLTAA
jgi:HK97 family phage prohead protease